MGKDKNIDDLRVEPVDGAPISLAKALDKMKPPGPVTVMVNQTGAGIVNDAPGVMNIGIADREMQADYFFGLNVQPMPEYLRKYLEYMYEDDKQDVEALYKYGASNPEFKHIVAMIQLVGGGIKQATRENKGVRFFIEEPETRMHPKRERRIMSMLEMLRKDYGPKEDEKKTETKI